MKKFGLKRSTELRNASEISHEELNEIKSITCNENIAKNNSENKSNENGDTKSNENDTEYIQNNCNQDNK